MLILWTVSTDCLMFNEFLTPSDSFPSHLIMVWLKCVACKDKFLTFEFEDDFLVVLHREEAAAASSDILKEHAIPSIRSSDLSEPYVETKNNIQKTSEDFGESPVTNFEMGIDCLLWAWSFFFNGWATEHEVSVKSAVRPVKCKYLPVNNGGRSTLPLCRHTRTLRHSCHVVC